MIWYLIPRSAGPVRSKRRPEPSRRTPLTARDQNDTLFPEKNGYTGERLKTRSPFSPSVIGDPGDEHQNTSFRKEKQMEYAAFISYRHLEPDASVAKKLAEDIEQFVIPKSLRKNGLKKPGRVFRDREELPLSTSLKDSLYHALDESEYLIMICSPELLQSKYCMEELRYFLTGHSVDHVLTVLVRGTPAEAFPPALLTQTDPETGLVRDIEPLAADVTGASLKEHLKKLKTEKLRILAACLGCRYDDLVQRSRRRRRKKAAIVSAAALVLAAVFAAVLTNFIHARNEEQRSRMQTDARLLIRTGQQLTAEGRHREAVQTVLEAVELEQNGHFSLEGQEYLALADAAAVYETDVVLPDRMIRYDRVVDQVTLLPGGKYLLIDDDDGKRVRYDIETGKTEEGDFSGLYTADGSCRITKKDEVLQVLRADDGSPLYSYGDVYRFFADEDTDTLLVGRRDSYAVCRLSTGGILAEAARDDTYAEDDFAVTGDGKAAAVLLHRQLSGAQQFLNEQNGTETKAVVLILTGSSASLTYELPDPGKGALIPTLRSLIYVCPSGLYLIDPEDTFEDFPCSEPFEFMSFPEYGMDASQFYVKIGKKNVLLFGSRFLAALDRETGLMINALTFDDYSPVIGCSWIDAEETHAVFVTSSGSCYHYYDEHEGLEPEDMNGFDTHRYDGKRLSGLIRQQSLLSPPDLARSCSDGKGIILAAVTREDRQVIRLYRYYQNDRAEYLSLNDFRMGQLYTVPLAGGHLVREDGWADRTAQLTLLEFTDGSYTQRPLSVGEPFWGLSADRQTAYGTFHAFDLSTGTSTAIVSDEQKKKLEETPGGLYAEYLDSRNNNLRMFISEADGVISVIALMNDRVLWEDVFPCEGTPFFDDADPTIVGKNGWASTPVMKRDGSFVWVLTDLYDHRFSVIPGPSYRNGMMGTDPDGPVYAVIDGDLLRFTDCRTGENSEAIPLPVKGESIRDIEMLQNDRAVFLAAQDLTVFVIDRKNGDVLYTRHVPFGGVYYGSMILHLYEGDGEFCYTFRNEGLAKLAAEEKSDKAAYYTAGYNVDMLTWKEKWIAPRLHSVQYDVQRMVVYDSTYTKCFSLPILTNEELLKTAQALLP